MLQRIRNSAATHFTFLTDKFHLHNIYEKVLVCPENDEIRLLRFESNLQITRGVPLRCTFQIVSLKSGGSDDVENAVAPGRRTVECRPAYNAVSYTWGTNPSTTSMIINGSSVLVPVNTEIALRNLLAHKRCEAAEPGTVSGQVIYLWIDAICINQQDVREKSQQVALMSRIYSSANEVLVWLGEDKAREGLKIKQVLEDVYADCAQATDDFAKLRDTISPEGGNGFRVTSNRFDRSQPHIVDTPLFTKEVWELLTRFFSLPWFSRVWIIQEIVLASKAKLYWGDMLIAWPIAAVAGRWIYYGRAGILWFENERLTLASVITKDVLEHVVTLYTKSAQAHTEFPGSFSSARNLSSVLFASANFHATDPRDSIYALLGLLSAQTREKCTALLPDYSSDLATVYTAATRALMEQGRTVSFLKQAGLHQASQPGAALPSWVPHWGQKGRALHGSCRPISDRIFSPHFMPERALRETTSSPHILSVKGMSVEKVARLGPSFSLLGNVGDPDVATRTEAMVAWARQITRAHLFARVSSFRDQRYGTGYEQSFLITLFCGRMVKGEQLPALDEDALEDGKAMLKCFGGLQADSLVPLNVALRFPPLAETGQNRTFFVTSEGRYGMAPPGTQEGDHIVFISGHAWPFVLRQIEDHWVFLGDVYVDGLMSGMHWKELAQGDAVWMDVH